jgi:RNA polymerase sigma-70 factor, ECF subfamily
LSGRTSCCFVPDLGKVSIALLRLRKALCLPIELKLPDTSHLLSSVNTVIEATVRKPGIFPLRGKSIQRVRKIGLHSGKRAAISGDTFERCVIERVLNGERELFYALVQPYEKSIFAAALAMVKNRTEAEDIAQDAVLKAFQNLDRFRKESKFSTWLTQIAINEARMRLRKSRRRVHESIEETAVGEDKDYRPKDLADWREIPTETLERKELRETLLQALAELPAKYREVLILRDVQNLDTAETARVLNISIVAVKSRLLRARLQMRDALAPGIDGAWSLGETKWRRVRAW